MSLMAAVLRSKGRVNVLLQSFVFMWFIFVYFEKGTTVGLKAYSWLCAKGLFLVVIRGPYGVLSSVLSLIYL